jgi:hypothetical protein
MNIYFIQDRKKQKIVSGIPWNGLVLHKMLNIWLFMFHLSSMSNDKEGEQMQEV